MSNNCPYKIYPYAPYLDRDDRHYRAVLNTITDELKDLKLEIKKLERLIISISDKLVKTIEEAGDLHHSTNLKAINEIGHQINLKIVGEDKKPNPYKYSYPFQRSEKKFTTKLDKVEDKKEYGKEEEQNPKNETESTSTTG